VISWRDGGDRRNGCGCEVGGRRHEGGGRARRGLL